MNIRVSRRSSHPSSNRSSGSLGAARARALRLRQDLSLTAMLSESMSDLATPTLAAIDFPADELGRIAARIVLDRLDSGQTAATQVLLRPQLIVRDSTTVPRIQPRRSNVAATQRGRSMTYSTSPSSEPGMSSPQSAVNESQQTHAQTLHDRARPGVDRHGLRDHALGAERRERESQQRPAPLRRVTTAPRIATQSIAKLQRANDPFDRPQGEPTHERPCQPLLRHLSTQATEPLVVAEVLRQEPVADVRRGVGRPVM